MQYTTRLRLTFTRQGAVRYVGHLDMVKVWERVLRRAELPVAYSQGFHPQPKIQFASALPVGCASTAEMLDVFFTQPITPQQAAQAITPQLPAGMQITAIVPVPPESLPLQAILQSADYTLTIETDEPAETIAGRIQALLKAPSLPRQRRGKPYDLRPLLLDLKLQQADEKRIVLWARLKAGQDGGTGRPDELLEALGLGDAPVEICRVSLNV